MRDVAVRDLDCSYTGLLLTTGLVYARVCSRFTVFKAVDLRWYVRSSSFLLACMIEHWQGASVVPHCLNHFLLLRQARHFANACNAMLRRSGLTR